MKKTIILGMITLAITGCSTQKNLQSSDTSKLVIGECPHDEPAIKITKDNLGNCTKTTTRWIPQEYKNGEDYCIKDVTTESLGQLCPK